MDEGDGTIRCAVCGGADGHMVYVGDTGWVCDACDTCPTCGEVCCMEDSHA